VGITPQSFSSFTDFGSYRTGVVISLHSNGIQRSI
jgi:hypothetical protein